MKVNPTDNGYVLENAGGETLILSAQELAELVRDGHRLIDPQLTARLFDEIDRLRDALPAPKDHQK